MPYPQNLEFAHKVEAIIREEGAVPATIAILDGKMKVGLNEEELERMCHADGVGKVSRRDLATYLATGMPGATTVTTTMIIAAYAGIRFLRPAVSAACIAAQKNHGYLRRPSGACQHACLRYLRRRKEHS